MKIIASFKDEKITEDEVKALRLRKSVRAVIFDSNNLVALLFSEKGNYYTLPGGGIEDDETFEQAVVRECKEETGCEVEIVKSLGTIHEFRKKDNLLNESWGYVVKVVGEKGDPVFVGDENEYEKSSIVKWVTLSQALEYMDLMPAQDNLYHQYMIDRDKVFIRYAAGNKN